MTEFVHSKAFIFTCAVSTVMSFGVVIFLGSAWWWISPLGILGGGVAVMLAELLNEGV